MSQELILGVIIGLIASAAMMVWFTHLWPYIKGRIGGYEYQCALEGRIEGFRKREKWFTELKPADFIVASTDIKLQIYGDSKVPGRVWAIDHIKEVIHHYTETEFGMSAWKHDSTQWCGFIDPIPHVSTSKSSHERYILWRDGIGF